MCLWRTLSFQSISFAGVSRFCRSWCFWFFWFCGAGKRRKQAPWGCSRPRPWPCSPSPHLWRPSLSQARKALGRHLHPLCGLASVTPVPGHRSGRWIDALRQGITRFSRNDLFIVVALGWVFSSFLQGIAGFGTPIAIVAPLLVAFGVRPV
jgi:hypothetical protein